MNNKAIGIARVSSKGQADVGISYEVQEAGIREYCFKHDLELIRIEKYHESAKSSAGRKLYHGLIEKALKEKLYNHLYYMNDRECRNLTDAELNERLVLDGKIAIHYVRDSKIYDKNSSDSDFFNRDMNSVMNKHYSRNVRTKVKDAMKEKASGGWFPGNRPPYGYKTLRDSDSKGRFIKKSRAIIVPDVGSPEIMQVRREFELKAQGLSFKAIADRLVDEGLALSCYPSAVEKRLKNEFYGGFFYWDGILYKGNHELIITPALYQAVHKSFGGRGKSAGEKHVLASGWLRCEECGCFITYDKKEKLIKRTGERKVYQYFRCANGKGMHEKIIHITAEKIWPQLEAVLDHISIPEDLAFQISQSLNQNKDTAKASLNKKLIELDIDLKIINQRAASALDKLLAGKISQDAYDGLLNRDTQAKSNLAVERLKIQESLNNFNLENAQSTLELAKSAKSLWFKMSEEEKHGLLKLILSNQTLDGVTVRFKTKKPFELLHQMASSKTWYTHGDSNPGYRREKAMS